MVNLFKSWAIKGPNLLNVLGILVAEFILITWLVVVVIKTWSLPDLLSGLSSKLRSDWWVISGLKSAGSLCNLFLIYYAWSSPLRRTIYFLLRVAIWRLAFYKTTTTFL